MQADNEVCCAESALELRGPGGERHVIAVQLRWEPRGDEWWLHLVAHYEHGSSAPAKGAPVADWSVHYESPRPEVNNPGGVVFSGRDGINIDLAELRGIGLGKLLMRPLVMLVRLYPAVPVAPLILVAEDARTEAARARRNRFYQQLGFDLSLLKDGVAGESQPMSSSCLKTPALCLSEGWEVSVSGDTDVWQDESEAG